MFRPDGIQYNIRGKPSPIRGVANNVRGVAGSKTIQGLINYVRTKIHDSVIGHAIVYNEINDPF